MRRAAAHMESGGWWRCTEYEIADGYVRPTAGARLERYDPWTGFDKRGKGDRLPRPPYDALLGLARHFRDGSWDPAALQPDAEHAITAWCATHGLLGLLPHMTLFVALEPGIFLFPRPVLGSPAFDVSPMSLQHTALGWKESIPSLLVRWPEGEPLPDSRQAFLEARPEFRAHVVLHGLREPEIHEEPLTETWAQFFPSISKDEVTFYPYPLPDTDEFWRLYAEPISWFVQGAVAFGDMIAGIEPLDRILGATRESHPDPVELLEFQEAWDLLHVLTHGVRAALPLAPGTKPQRRWESPSLLASFAMMAMLVLEGAPDAARRHRRCAVCSREFVTTAWGATYCSDRCRRTAQQRAYRQRVRTKKVAETADDLS